ncbi:MAG: tetratricopeptide repeat protein [Phycisphaerae bacterium]|nr:tetratricopeptide repeat protein [Phycisphaerae bacterium]
MRRGMCVAVVAAWLLASAGLASAEQASVLLEKGIYTEETQGDPSAAIPIYQQVLAETQADRQVIAQAHFHLAICHRKLKQDAKARELLKQFVQQYPDQEALVAKARPILEELTEFDPATLMPPDTLLYVEMGSPGAQLEKVLNMLEGTPFANPLTALPGAASQPAEGAASLPSQPGEAYPPYPGAPQKTPGQIMQAMLNPSMIKEFKKIRGAAMGLKGLPIGRSAPVVAVLRPGESDAIRGILTAVLMAAGQPVAPIEGMQVVQFESEAACAFDDEVFIVASPPSQLEWCVRQYKGAEQPSLATANSSFTSLAPAASRRKDALTVWADPARCLEAARPMIGGGGMRDLAMITALADIPNMKGAVGRLRLVENGLTIEVTVAYAPTHRSLFYDLVRTPAMSGAAFGAVPQQAVAMAGLALQPAALAGDPSAGIDTRTALVQHVTGLDLGRELFGNIQEIVVFLDAPGEGIAGPDRGVTFWRFATRSLGAVIVSRDPAQTRAVLDRLLSLPGTLSGVASTQPAPDKTEYDLVSTGEGKLTAYLAQEGHTTVLSLNPTVRDAALEALRGGRNARTGGPLAKALAETQGDSKVVMVSVGGILRLIDAANPPPATTQPTTGPAAPSTLAQLAAALANTTARVETIEQDDTFTLRLTLAEVPPLKDVFPLFMQLQQEQAARNRVRHEAAIARFDAEQAASVQRHTEAFKARLGETQRARFEAEVAAAAARGEQIVPLMLRTTADKFVGALGRGDQAVITELILPDLEAQTKVADVMTKADFSTFRVREVRRNGPIGVAVAMDDPPAGRAPAGTLVIMLHVTEESVWRVFDLKYVALDQAWRQATQPSTQPSTGSGPGPRPGPDPEPW